MNPKPLEETVSEQLRSIIRSDGRTAYAIGKAAKVDPGVIARFMSGERSLTLYTLDKLAPVLGLKLSQEDPTHA
jgi:transcriptional regulator with XRE-family HTH domain